MPITVPAGFNDLRRRLALTEAQVQTADARIAALKTFLSGRFELSRRPIAIGSYARNTIVRPERDIDLLVPFSYPAYEDLVVGDDSRALLYMVRDALNERYSSTKVSSQQIAVKLDFTDITVDVVPAYPRRGGGYLVANGSRGWQSTNPPFHTTHMAQASSGSNVNLKVVVRLMKYWNLVNGRHLSSLHVELLVAAMWGEASMDGQMISTVMAKTLKAMPGWVRDACPDPWDSGAPRIDGYLSSTDRQTAMNLLASDAEAASVAEEYRRQGNIARAYERWDVVFRHNFPAYG